MLMEDNMPLIISAFKTEERREINGLINEFNLDMSFEKVIEILNL